MNHSPVIREQIANLQARLLVMLALLMPLERLEAADASEIPMQLTVCGDEEGYPPFSYFDGDKVSGYNVDFLQELLIPLGYSIEFILLPWPRCLAQVSNGAIDMAMDVSSSPERQREFIFPRPHYTTTVILIQTRHVAQVNTPAELESQKVCIINGWAFSALGMSADARPAGTPLTPEAAADMLRTGRCNILAFSREALLGYSRLDPQFRLSVEDLISYPIPWEVRGEKHFAVSRRLSYGERLVELLDQGIARLFESGAATRILQPYLQPALQP